MANMIERLHNVTERVDAPPTKRKIASVDGDPTEDDAKRNKSTFNASSNGNIIGDHLRTERQKLVSQVSNASDTVDLTTDNAGDDDVVVTAVKEVSDDDEICIGVIHATISTYRVPHVSVQGARAVGKDFWPPTKITLEEQPLQRANNHVIHVRDRKGNRFGKLELRVAQVIGPIMAANHINKTRFTLMLLNRPRDPNQSIGDSVSLALKAEITIFCPRHLARNLGHHLSKHQLFLSNPRVEVNRQVVNPHDPQVFQGVVKSGTNTNKPGSSATSSYVARSAEEITRQTSAMFDQLAEAAELPEAEAAGEFITTSLLPHQKQGLYFLIKHENTEDVDNQAGSTTSLWQYRPKNNGRPAWCHIITGEEVLEKPKPLQGGILADMMGLGKSLSILALIASTYSDSKRFRNKRLETQHGDTECNARGTLIICPKSVLSAWDDEIKKHVVPGKFRVYLYHGSSRMRYTHELAKFDIVLTTYSTVASEWNNGKDEKAALASINWFRVVLDEAHTIRNTSSKIFNSCCEIHAERRWAVSGTPLQNYLNDLGALIRFLRLRPFDKPKVWQQYIMAPLKGGDVNAVKQLQLIVKSITLRRLKTRVDLPELQEQVVRLDFSPPELSLYQAFLAKLGASVRIMTTTEKKVARQMAEKHVFKTLFQLRAIAAHGREMLSEADMKEIEGDTAETAISIINLGDEPGLEKGNEFLTQDQAYEELESMKSNELNRCMSCERELDNEKIVIDLDSDDESDDSNDQNVDSDIIGYFTPCLHLLCQQCKADPSTYQSSPTEDGHYTCPTCNGYRQIGLIELRYSVRQRLENLRQNPQRLTKGAKWTPDTYSGPHTKVRALLEEIKRSAEESSELPPDEPPIRSVVFSQWTQILDLIAFAFAREGILHLRLDGTMSVPQRTSVLKTFRTDPSIRVLLVSIQAGGTGLTLTAANRAYIMDPGFNPGVEDQAADRLHRYGQTRPVRITYFVMNDSVEEMVRKVSQRKRQIAAVAVDGGGARSTGSAKERMEKEKELKMEEIVALFKGMK
jgi:SWI/SNF related-matrix-associated actin-dependent regulator of chromatin subfamily C